MLPKLFDEKEATNRPGSEDEGGTGFGMLQVKLFTESGGGQVFVESKTGEGSGTTFYLHLPIAAQESEAS